MITKDVYKEIDSYFPKSHCFNLKKKRSLSKWIICVWNAKELDEKGISASWIQTTIYPEYCNEKENILNLTKQI